MKVKVPQLRWYENNEKELEFPSSWSIFCSAPAGATSPKLDLQAIDESFANPIGCSPIHLLAKGKKEVAILFDDLTRPTPVSELVPYLLRELERAGIKDRQIRFICALGAHGAHTAIDFTKKLGTDVIDRFPVYNHNAFAFCADLGKTSRGTPVWINKEVMACDLKIGIGCILPHPFSGFGGGAKIILPGVAHIDSIAYNHRTILENHPGCIGLGKIEGNIPRLDIEEACAMSGLDIKIDALLNLRAEITSLFIGNPILAHREGTGRARQFYLTAPARNMDVVVVNTYLKSAESAIAMLMGAPSLKEQGGDLVVICNEPAGQVVHYLFGEFGRCGEASVAFPRMIPDRVNRVILLSPFRDEVGAFLFRKAAEVIWVKSWEEVIELLEDRWGDRANVALYPDGTMQYCL